MRQRTQATSYLSVLTLAVCLGAWGCASDDTDLTKKYLDDVGLLACVTLDFETDAAGLAIAAGDVATTAYEAVGMSIDVWRGGDTSDAGLAVVFDGANPTGGDDDLFFPDAGNLLISQEQFSADEVASGSVAEPDDDASGALFDFVSPTPFCAQSLTFLDIDEGEEPTVIRLYGADGTLLGEQFVPPAGNNSRQDVTIEADTICDVVRMTVELPSSGALDDLTFCPNDGGGGGGDDGPIIG